MTPKPLPLPIDQALPHVLQQLKERGTLVLQAQPGAGKTTRVPQVILDAGIADTESHKNGQIVVLQPRRVAARAAAVRISYERGTQLGQEVGYQVRFDKRSSKNTRILICTEGIFLRRLQDDPTLENIAVVIFDEFHERSIDSDLALALVRQVRKELRPDLRVVVMSATLESSPVSKYLDNSPIVQSQGKTYPLTLEYLPFPPKEPVQKLVGEAVSKMLTRSTGDLLVFLPGIAEIRQTQSHLESQLVGDNCVLLPLYGDLPLEDQQQVLEPSSKRKIILATNVAETSLTIDGVKSVIDSGLVRVNMLDPRLGLNRLHLMKVSKASADQRAGRAARTAPGTCLRLWSEKEQQMLRDFETPEIARVELSQCLLQLFAWGEHNVKDFPWFEPPPAPAVDQALLLLDRLDALDHGMLTKLGKEMANLPLQPRIARLLIEGASLGQAKRAALCAALLSERDAFRRKDNTSKAEHHSESDVLDRLSAIERFENDNVRHTEAGEILTGPAKQILRAGAQLLALIEDRIERNDCDNVTSDQAILKSLLCAFPDRVCKRREPAGRRAIMIGGRGVKLADGSALDRGEFFLAIELIETGQSELLVTQASKIEKEWLNKAHLKTVVETAYDTARQKVMALKRTRFFDLLIEESVVSIPPELDTSSVLAKAVIEHIDIETIVDEESKQLLARLQCLSEWMPELDLPDFGSNTWTELLPDWCTGCTSIDDLKNNPPISIIMDRLSCEQQFALEREAPSRITVPSGSRIKVMYRQGEPPVVAVRVQEMFGMKETPRIASSRIPVLLHLLAPNYRIQQITPDLASFWKNTYPDVKKDLRRRYPKHSWPDDPLTATAEHRPKPKPKPK